MKFEFNGSVKDFEKIMDYLGQYKKNYLQIGAAKRTFNDDGVIHHDE